MTSIPYYLLEFFVFADPCNMSCPIRAQRSSRVQPVTRPGIFLGTRRFQLPRLHICWSKHANLLFFHLSSIKLLEACFDVHDVKLKSRNRLWLAAMGVLDSLSYPYATVGILALVLYLVTGAIYRLYLSPVSKFPGPKLAALTFW